MGFTETSFNSQTWIRRMKTVHYWYFTWMKFQDVDGSNNGCFNGAGLKENSTK
jgi:hypothetical protein